MEEPVYVVSTKMIDEGKVHAKTEDPHEDVGKLEKDGDKTMNEENERKTVKKIAHASKGFVVVLYSDCLFLYAAALRLVQLGKFGVLGVRLGGGFCGMIGFDQIFEGEDETDCVGVRVQYSFVLHPYKAIQDNVFVKRMKAIDVGVDRPSLLLARNGFDGFVQVSIDVVIVGILCMVQGAIQLIPGGRANVQVRRMEEIKIIVLYDASIGHLHMLRESGG
ncbi:hypothetical protein Tco_0908888 [Tanacetum coccineum]|uniref:Uncharacterized protein n=1 Tax=Tanacetum coccineum TaxID=301880 RepID=A0ABQ5CP28_9ASTR